MTETWMLAGLWLALALIAALFSVWFRVATALSEIVVGVTAQLVIGYLFGASTLGADQSWIKFLSNAGAIMLTFLAGAEIDPDVFKLRWREATGIGIASFLSPFLGCTVLASYFLNWTWEASWLAGVALSTTSVAVVYAVMLEFRLNKTVFGKTVLAACFITDLGTVLALGLIFSPFTIRTVIFVMVSLVVCIGLPFFTPRFFRPGADPLRLKRNSYSECSSEWELLQGGQEARRCFLPTSSGWSWRKRWGGTISSSGG